MQRRKLMVGIGVGIALSGCLEDSTPSPTDSSQENSESENSNNQNSTGNEEKPSPADFQITSLSTDSSEVSPGESVSITATVENIGGERGSHIVELYVDENTRDTTTVELEAGDKDRVQFEITMENPGRYEITVGEEETILQVVAEPNITIQNQQLGVTDTWFNNGRAYAEATIENTGNARCGTIELVARWFDDSGSIIGEDSAFLPTLGAGETWIARVGTSRDRENIDRFELTGEYEIIAGDPPDGMSITDSAFNVEEPYRGRITAEIDNTREEELFMTSFEGVLYNDSGEVIAGNQTRESNVSPGENLFFELSFNHIIALHRIDEATDYNVFLIESENTDTRNI